MNKIIVVGIVMLAILLTACSSQPSGDTVGTAVAQTLAAQPPVLIVNTSTPVTPTWDMPAYKTQAAMTQAALSTNTPRPTNTAKPTHRPTATPLPKTTYILETGWCMLDVGIDEVSGKDPKTVQWCNVDAREQIKLADNEYMTLTLENLDGSIQVYCALFSLDGTFIMSDMDTTGSGKVTCPNE